MRSSKFRAQDADFASLGRVRARLLRKRGTRPISRARVRGPHGESVRPHWTSTHGARSFARMPTAELTRRIAFSAAHRYHRAEWSDERNHEVFGACSNPYGHGHNYVLDVTVRGAIDPVTGFSVDLRALDALLKDEVGARLGHQHLNHAVPEFADGGLVPTCENIAAYLWPRLEGGMPAGVELRRIRLHEEPGLYVDYYGDCADE
ncbi:MAG: 6-carboxytetrahydropterin synthase [Longimicrobiales bacterium]